MRYLSLRMHLVVATVVITSFLNPFAWAQPPQPEKPSQWNLLVEGGKGIFWTAPDCHQLQYFTGSPLLFDFEQDFFARKESDLRFTSNLRRLGVAGGRQVVQIVQRILEVDSGNPMVAKRLLVSRGDGQFCAIYQQLYDAAQVVVKPASLFTFDGERVLKTLDQNGNATWNEEYWTFNASGAIHLDLAYVRKQMQQAAPKGDLVVTYPLDLKAVCHKTLVSKPEGNCPNCEQDDGFMLAKLALAQGRLTATWARWFPSGVNAVCPVD